MSKRNIESIYPLTPMQQGMLFHSLYAPESGVYVEQLRCRVGGDIDVPAFQRAWQFASERHPVLRTAFVWKKSEQMLQVVHRQVTIPVEWLDWRDLAADAQQARFEELVAADRRRGFDVSRAPLTRLTLVRTGDDAWRLLWTHHHLLLDGWSIPILLRDVFTAYEAFRRNAAPPLPPARPYRDYVAWQQRQDLAAAEAFWRRTLAGFEAPTPLAIGRAAASPGADDRVYGLRERWLDPELSAALQAAARQQGLTLNTVVQGAWALALARTSGERDVVYGVTVSGRPADLPGAEGMVGLFINTLPVRARIDDARPWGAWLRDLQATQAEMRQYEYSPLVQVQGWSGVPRGTPLFESLFVFENYPVDETLREQAGSLAFSDVVVAEQTNFPLTLLSAPGQRVMLRASYDGSRFDDEAIERLLARLETTLAAMAADASATLGTLPFATADERRLVVEEWNATGRDYPAEATLVSLFEAQAARTPEAPAVRFEGATLTYAELDARANRLAHRLRRLGVGADVLVAVAMERSLDLVVALYGVLKAGGAYVPVDPGYPADRIAYMLEDATAPVLLTQAALVERLPAAPAGTAVLALDAMADELAAESGTAPGAAIAPSQLAYMIYTSGSTGRPKGAMNEHRGIVNRLLWMQEAFGLGARDVVLQKTPFSFDVSVWEFFWPLQTGAVLEVARPEGHKDPAYLADLIERARVTTLHFVPSMLQVFLEQPGLDIQCASVRRVICSGEALPYDLTERCFARLPKAELHNLYGPTEAAVDVSHWPCVRDEVRRLVPIGRPIANTRLYVLDPRGEPCPVDVPGELHIGGVQVGRGYHGRPDLTAERFVADPFAGTAEARMYRTGDLARWLADGTIEYLGRLDHQVKVRGFRIELGEIEAAIGAMPDVREAAVVARQDSPGDVRLVGYLVPAGERPVDVAALRAALGRVLPDYMVPSAFVALEALPLSPSGKVDRKALPAPEAGATAREYVAPRTPSEELVAGVWRQVLKLERVGVHDSFFELGGHSLLATQVVARLREAFGTDIPLRLVFESPNLAALAAAAELTARETHGTAMPAIVPAPRDGELPLSFAQQRLWFLDQLEPGSALYNNPTAIRLTGALDAAALERTLAEIVRRHEALRTTFGAAEGRPVQVIAAESPEPVLHHVDLTALPSESREAEAMRLAALEARRPFDLAGGPLFRVTLYRLGETDHLAMLVMHHIVSDGWSMGVMVREIAALYSAFAGGRAEGVSPLPPLPIQYADYAAWQRGWLQGEALERQVSYWRKQLAGAPPLLELPTDRPRPAVQSFRGATRWFRLPAALSRELGALSQREGVTLFMTLLAGWQALLSRYSGQTDVSVGTPIANRTRAELEGLIGFFVNTLVLRTDLSGSPSFRELLGRVRETALGAYAHQDLPFETLVEAVQPTRDLKHTPLFQVMFVLDNSPRDPVVLDGLTLAPVEAESGVSRFDMTLLATETADGLAGSVQYSTDLFDASTIDRMLGHWERLLAAVAADPARPVSSIPLLDDAERAQVVGAWNHTAAPFAAERCAHEIVAAHAALRPDAEALRFEGRSVSYGELDARANRLAHHLRSLGVEPDSLVGVCAERSPELIVALLAAMKAGGAYLPLDPAYPADRLRFMLEDAKPAVLLTTEQAGGALPATGVPTFRLDADAHLLAALPTTTPDTTASPESLAYVIYTSGSTGRPKGALLEHQGLANLVGAQRRLFGIEPGRRVLQFASPSFDASVWETFMALGNGATLVLAPRDVLASPEELAGVLRREAVTTVTLPPSMLRNLSDRDLTALDTIIVAGERCPRELVERWAPGRRFFNAYGPTETTVCATVAQCDPSDLRSPSIGRPLPNVTAHVLDTAMQPVPVGVPGELWVGGVALARGYHDRPELTAERFVPDPFSDDVTARLYRTGDLVRRRADGEIEFLGRVDEQVKIRGFRIELGEVESALAAHPGVREAVALAREDAPGEQRLVAYLVAADGAELSVGELRGFLRERLPEFMVPSVFVPVDAIPLTPNGKVDRRALPAPDGARTDLQRPYVAPTTEAEVALAAICAELLGVERVGRDDDFFELGGHSLLATQLVARVRERFSVELPLRALFETPNVAGLARAVEAATEEGAEATALADALARLDELSEDEVLALLAAKRAMPEAGTAE
jgi:amino acid adenylation domain-containing protein